MLGELPGQRKRLPSGKRVGQPLPPCSLGSTQGAPPAVGGQGQGSVAGFGLDLLLGVFQDLDCFVIDGNGFILISERAQEVRYLGGGTEGSRCPEKGGKPSQPRPN